MTHSGTEIGDWGMPELFFKGKEFVYNHHLSVPFRPLIPDSDKSIAPERETPRLDGNLIIHGDNLHALKALLPMYAGKVDCVFIDPPYNTGNEGWSYNDNVNSPMMREWLNSNPVGLEDGLRHDKWLCMMYPRLKLLHELLSDQGSFWMTLDDNEVGHARVALDEIFGEGHLVGQIVWQKRTSRENRAVLSPSFDHLLVYSKSSKDYWKLFRNKLDPDGEGFSNPDKDKRGPWKSVPFSAQGYRKNQVYKITSPTGVVHEPPRGRCWSATEDEYKKLDADDRIYFPKDGDGRPRVKRFPWEDEGLVPDTLWFANEVGDTEDSKKQLLDIFSDREELDFHAPKPIALIERILKIATKRDSIVLDSFAGSGSTGHAVLSANKRDGLNRKFILVEMEGYADSFTAERIRRAINGYSFKGAHREELLKEDITFRALKSADKLLERVAGIENLEAHRFDQIKKEVKGGSLVITGEKSITENMPGLGGSFTYCTLGEPLDLNAMLSGKALPSFEQLGAWLFHTATNEAFDPAHIDPEQFYVGESAGYHVWLRYKPELEFLKSRDAALTLAWATELAERHPIGQAHKRHLVFAPAKFAANKQLLPLGVEHAPLPFSLFKIER